MKSLHTELKKTYKFYDRPSIIAPVSKQHYQKKVVDNKWTKYFINCIVYDTTWVDIFEFDVQLTNNNRSINISTVSWFNDAAEKYRKYPELKEVEDIFENLWIAYWWEYYEEKLN
jgi:hypothetical protein